jgi:hypothetical protein
MEEAFSCQLSAISLMVWLAVFVDWLKAES